MRGLRLITGLLSLMLIAPSAFGEPTTSPLKIVSIRPYNVAGSPGAVYLEMSQASLCNTSVYKIDLSFSGSKEVLSVALAALMADKNVQVEIVNSGCTGWGSTVQSLFLIK